MSFVLVFYLKLVLKLQAIQTPILWLNSISNVFVHNYNSSLRNDCITINKENVKGKLYNCCIHSLSTNINNRKRLNVK